jgi:hypothetical protein
VLMIVNTWSITSRNSAADRNSAMGAESIPSSARRYAETPAASLIF